MTRRTRRTANLVRMTLEAQAAALTVLGIRIPALLGGTASRAERTRMVAEKCEAATEGARDAAWAAARLCGRATTASALLGGWVAIGEAALRPSHKRVTANAARLTRSRKPRSG